MRVQTSIDRYHVRLIGAAVAWLLGGSLALATTLVPMYTRLLGWTPAFWLLAAPLLVLVALRSALPREQAVRRRSRRRVSQVLIWH